jgi:hypothetical protein
VASGVPESVETTMIVLTRLLAGNIAIAAMFSRVAGTAD